MITMVIHTVDYRLFIFVFPNLKHPQGMCCGNWLLSWVMSTIHDARNRFEMLVHSCSGAEIPLMPILFQESS